MKYRNQSMNENESKRESGEISGEIMRMKIINERKQRRNQ
jgi:hypothetical protein